MSLSKSFERAAPLLAVLAVLAIVGLVITTITDNTSQAVRDGAFGTSLSADEIIALFTVALSVSTVGLWIATHSLGARADRGLHTLERAYVYPVLSNADSMEVASMLDRAVEHASDHDVRLALKFSFRNFGKTPATIISVEGRWSHHAEKSANNPRPQVVLAPVLGANESTNEMEAVILLSPGHAAEILISASPPELAFRTSVTYVDIFGDEHRHTLLWRYHQRLRRLIPARE
ncbi:hypothetical protein [Terricaulis sp.]|uniref:hypothetical protein n=1 Tax=Terricaulis sp. TaxID=2768686 RepID=UPI002AC5375F|nr:hypothetical protein [Terricaulis sp.]MDZ4693115.1 hypothetical protein [Terricaulis sp.]